MTAHCILEEDSFVDIFYKHLEQHRYENFTLKTVLKLMVNKGLKCQKKDEYVRFKNYETKIKLPFTIMIYVDFETM